MLSEACIYAKFGVKKFMQAYRDAYDSGAERALIGWIFLLSLLLYIAIVCVCIVGSCRSNRVSPDSNRQPMFDTPGPGPQIIAMQPVVFCKHDRVGQGIRGAGDGEVGDRSRLDHSDFNDNQQGRSEPPPVYSPNRKLTTSET